MNAPRSMIVKTPRAEGYGAFLFHDLRYRDDGSENPDFVLNREPYRREPLLKGVDELGSTLELLPRIEAFERDYAGEAPWIIR